ncbi:putative nucleotide-diphospho-sugar transferase [Medicago truncatula]|uniref:Putative nucleotide-diphospho-sugar transferase n=1 Tax=Medicago truncatula TaxID=3880 RepID=A0A396IH33_MEDTR|nr:putative nucleotide-diphospho-sugar transferase [Medicago truncatula]
MYLADLVPATAQRIIYFDSDLIIVDDLLKCSNSFDQSVSEMSA